MYIKTKIRNADYNKYKNVEVITKAVTNHVGKAIMIQVSAVHSYLLKNDKPHSKKIQVPTTTIDSFLSEKNENIDFIFMDAEGFEEYILRGATNTIKNNDKLKIITEYNPKMLVSAGTSPESFIDTISDFGFNIHVIDQSRGEIEKYNKKRLLKDFSIKNEYPLPKYTNLFLTKT